MSMGGTAGAGAQGAGLVRPPHPRFGASSGGGGESSSMGMGMSSMGMMGGGGASTAPEDTDTELYNWIYVDFDGKPLTKSEIDGSPTSRIVRLMPFMLRIQIGEQKLDDFLVELATQAPVPIDVRQVRINPSAMGGGGGGEGMGSGGMGGMGGMGPSRAGRSGGGSGSMGRMSSSMGGSEGMGMTGMGGEDTGRPNDLEVEIRGTIAIVAPPDADVVGLAEDEIPQPDDALPLDPLGPANTDEETLSEGDVS